MIRRTLFSLSLALPLSILCSPGSALAWDSSYGSGPRIQGSGKPVHETRALGAFSRIRMDDSLSVNARQTGKTGAVVHADDNIAPLIQTVIDGDTLVIKVKPGSGFRTGNPITIDVEFSELRAADLRGSGDLNIDGIKGDGLTLGLAGSGDLRLKSADLTKLSVSIAGSGDVVVQGRAAEFSANIAGSGDIRALELNAKAVNVNIAGSGDARVNASESLAVQIAGSGDVTYTGTPKLSSRVMGSGEVRASR
jgi:hypothetical protein